MNISLSLFADQRQSDDLMKDEGKKSLSSCWMVMYLLVSLRISKSVVLGDQHFVDFVARRGVKTSKQRH